MTTVMIAVVVLAVLGAIFGLVLAIASKVFAVEVDPREEAILGLPSPVMPTKSVRTP